MMMGIFNRSMRLNLLAGLRLMNLSSSNVGLAISRKAGGSVIPGLTARWVAAKSKSKGVSLRSDAKAKDSILTGFTLSTDGIASS